MIVPLLAAVLSAVQFTPPQSNYEPPGAEKTASLAASTAASPRDLLTPAETSNYTRTGRYAEAVEYARKLEKLSPWVRVEKFGTTPQGRDMIMLVVSKDRAFTPQAAARTGKPVIYIQNGIHSGEIAGKDATFMLLRDIVITKRFAGWLDHVILLVVPVFNIDGHERMSPYNRMNQNGPEEMGWRTTAQGLNLNRDYIKADAPEMRAFLKMYTAWLPEMLIDNHVTDGADYQYDLTISAPTQEEVWPTVGRWNAGFLKAVIAALDSDGHVCGRYADPRDPSDLSKGLVAWGTTPRFSDGYAAVQNRVGVLVETHSLKRYRTRVWAHYDLMRHAIEYVAANPKALKDAVAQADREIAGQTGRRLFVAGEAADGPDKMVYRGLARRMEKAEAIGGMYPVYGAEPVNETVTIYDRARATFEPVVPVAYAVPREWTSIIELLAAHGVPVETLESERAADVETYTFSNVRWAQRPFEGRLRVSFETQVKSGSATLPAGTVLVPMNQRAARVALSILEPQAPDSAVSWGLMNTIFEQKEYAEPYLLEPLAQRMLASDARLRDEFAARMKDPEFANSPAARRQFFYERSPYWDARKDAYPVLRVMRLN
ncbi:MAG: M14 family metallopeptidase [bacterium]|jgi:murein tripeptide amidase MpaA